MKKTIICASTVLVALSALNAGLRPHFVAVGSEEAIPLTKEEKDQILGGVACKSCVEEWVGPNILLGGGDF